MTCTIVMDNDNDVHAHNDGDDRDIDVRYERCTLKTMTVIAAYPDTGGSHAGALLLNFSAAMPDVLKGL